jgi:hypothetical protein
MKPKRILLIAIVLFVLSVIAGLNACSPQKRINRITAKHPHLVQKDTVWITDTIIVEGVRYDTITKFLTNTKVEVINNERVRLQYFYDTLTKEIHHEVECKENRIVYERSFVVDKVITTHEWEKYLKWLVILLVVVVGVRAFIKYLW